MITEAYKATLVSVLKVETDILSIDLTVKRLIMI